MEIKASKFGLYSLINGKWGLIETGRFKQPLVDQADQLSIAVGAPRDRYKVEEMA